MTDLRTDLDLPHPVERVWRALTDRRLLGEWLMPTDLSPVAGETYRMFPPPGLAGFSAPFDVDVVEVVENQRMVQRWSGDELHVNVLWELAPTPGGCRLVFTQSGFFGMQGTRRRQELRGTYRTLVGERLPAFLDRIAAGAVDLGDAVVDLHTAIPRKRDTVRPVVPLVVSPPSRAGREPEGDLVPDWSEPPRRRRGLLGGLPTHRRVRLLSLIGAVFLVVLLGSAVAVYSGGGRGATAPQAQSSYGVGSGEQPGVVDGGLAPSATGTGVSTADPRWTPAPSSSVPASTAVVVSGSPAPGASASPGTGPVGSSPLAASYRTVALLGLGGFDTEVTVRNPAATPLASGWTVVLTMPADRAVENRSAALVAMAQAGTKITVTPKSGVLAANGAVTFTIRFPAVLALGKAITACTVDGRPCTGA